ncbi:MAG: ParB/RepB/Spo0J family partition protein [Verrucomicrobia bacterium]|nr:ParB/RepB/Spo0J family partition protein [Verrucomicrobiota bacterium]
MATPPKKTLGRGLSSLIGGGVKPAQPAPAAPAPAAAASPAAAPAPAPAVAPVAPGLLLQELPLTSIVPNPRQPRRDFDDAAVKELADSIRSEGLMQPIVVRKVKDGYELIAGERRFRAFKLIGQKTITARIIDASDASSAVLALVENLQRADLNPIDEALGFASLMRDFNLTQDAVAERLGKPRATIANSVRLLALDNELQGYLRKGQLSAGHAKALLGLENAAHRVQVARLVIEKGLSVRATEAEVKKLSATKKTERKQAVQTVVADVQKRLAAHFATQVSVVRKGGKGSISIPFGDDDELARLLEKIGIKL